MSVNGPNNALAEVSLALAMGFFSIMVLAMVSMGAGASKLDTASVTVKKGMRISLPISPGLNKSQSNSDRTKPVSLSSILIYYRGRFLNAQFEDISPKTWRPEGQGVLAIEPTLSMSAAMKLRKQVHVSNVTVTTLDKRWLSTLKEKIK